MIGLSRASTAGNLDYCRFQEVFAARAVRANNSNAQAAGLGAVLPPARRPLTRLIVRPCSNHSYHPAWNKSRKRRRLSPARHTLGDLRRILRTSLALELAVGTEAELVTLVENRPASGDARARYFVLVRRTIPSASCRAFSAVRSRSSAISAATAPWALPPARIELSSYSSLGGAGSPPSSPGCS